MLQAELHNKEGSDSLISKMEDVLTSNVFGVLKNVNRYFLSKVFENTMGISLFKVDNLETKFWPTDYKFHLNKNLAAEPDCMMIADKLIILIEAKYHSDFGQDTVTESGDKNQLKREFALLQHLISEQERPFDCKGYLLIVTNDLTEPTERINSQFYPLKRPSNVYWTSWQRINYILKECVKKYSSEDEVSLKWVKELIELLDHKGLRDFRGFDFISYFKKRIEALDKGKSVYFDLSELVYTGYQNLENYLLATKDRIHEVPANIFFKI